jgi:hypothetical protein
MGGGGKMSELARIETEKTNDELLQALGEAWDNAAELRAEIERLKAHIKSTRTMEIFQDHQKEIQGIREELAIEKSNWSQLMAAYTQVHAQNVKLCSSIQELVDWIEDDTSGDHNPPPRLMITRAREAVK